MCSDPRVTKDNSFGETWETSNPHDPTADLTIAQVRRRELRRREADERVRRLEVEREGRRVDEELRAALIEAQGAPEDEAQ
jgi:hypothetical protein